jgi:hypothetical protein
MAIQSDKAHVTIDFVWAKDDNDGPEGQYSIRHHYTEEFGQTISVSTDGGDNYFAFPAAMFSEVVDFLRERSVVGSSPQQTKTVVAETHARLPIPEITSKEGVVATSDLQSFSSAQEVVDDSSKVDSLVCESEEDIKHMAEERKAAAERANSQKEKRKIKKAADSE